MDTFRVALIKELQVIRKGDDPEVAYGGCTGGTSSASGSEDDGAEPFIVNFAGDLTGLALSGGGIRSATFNLGLLQGLAERKIAVKDKPEGSLLDLFDYLSTVSGGGYIGSFWSAWRARNANTADPLFPTNCASRKDCAPGTPAAKPTAAFDFIPFQKRERETEPKAEAAANKKVPAAENPRRIENVRSEPDPIRHLREFSRFLAPRWGLFEIETWQFFGGALSAVLPALVVSFSVLALLIWFWYALFVSATGVAGNQLISIVRQHLPPVSYLYLALSVVGVSTLSVMWFFEKGTQGRERLEGDKSYNWRYWCAAFFSMTLAVLADYCLLLHIPRWSDFKVMPGLGWTVGGPARFLSPAICWSVSMVVLIAIRAIVSRFVDPRKGFRRAAIDRVIARLLGLAVFWTVMILFLFAAFILWSRDPKLVALWTTLVGGTSGGVFGYIQKIFSRQPSRAKGGARAWAERYALPLLAMTAVVAAALGVACLVFTCIAHDYALAGTLGPLGVTLAALVFYNPNEVGLHPIYRSRLSRAYLGASNAASAARNRQSIERRDDDLLLEELPKTRPVHLICCAANDLAGDHLANLSRGARSATLSRFGFTLANRFQRWDQAPSKLTLATAMTASAAAFNSNMGSLSMDLGAAATFLMASLNLRLGYWYHLTKTRAFFPGCDLFLEMFSRTNSGLKSNSIHLSDGGHFENLALYELLRRRCRYILASDCGADSEAAFDDVGNALRRAREDFGVEVVIDLAALKPNEKGFSNQHVAVGDIIYPDGGRGVLLLFKPTIVGDEPGDVLQYKTRNQNFPHESTGDQFYDEKQWESYRRLGLHAARIAFRFLDDRDVTDRSASDVFGSARKEWLSTPPTLPDQLMARSAELQAIERQVVTLGNLSLLRDLYPELKWKKDAPHSSDMKTKELAKLVPLFTQVLQLMTDVYVSCDLRSSWEHPLNIGWVNWFGRWSTTPAFRDLWPFLSPMFNPNMREFFEDRFELRSAVAWSKGWIVDDAPKDSPGLATELWKASHPGMNRDDCKTLRFRVKVREGWEVDVALLFYKEEKGGKVWNERWTDPDFFVPPSLWRAGIGSAFLAKIGKWLDENGPGVVRIYDDPTRRREVSDQVQDYSEAGFTRITSAQSQTIEMRRGLKKTTG